METKSVSILSFESGNYYIIDFYARGVDTLGITDKDFLSN